METLLSKWSEKSRSLRRNVSRGRNGEERKTELRRETKRHHLSP
jgi:hypothetical protein